MKPKKFIQQNPPHPGEILQELYFTPLKLSVTSAADKLFITRPNLSAILNGRAGISPVMALKLSRAFDTTPHYWLNLQANYDLWQAMLHDKGIEKVKMLV
ncbi:MAG: HigA family addiction module antidote protein [Cyclobacteriaceae bacterium]|nr:HigA family addiction module antidote protein [Cyclobacteriaceae bacterium]